MNKLIRLIACIVLCFSCKQKDETATVSEKIESVKEMNARIKKLVTKNK